MSGCLDSLGEIKVFVFIAKSEKKDQKPHVFSSAYTVITDNMQLYIYKNY